MKKAFTLIELLVVVLIIGILAAIALPQYEKAVEKSKSAQMVTMLKSITQAAEEYFLTNSDWPSSFSDLSVTPPWTGNTNWYSGYEVTDVRSDENFSLQLVSTSTLHGVNIGRLSGRYKGGGFVMWYKYGTTTEIPFRTIICAEKISDIENPGDYCQRVVQSGPLFYTGTTLRYYKML